jgi:hypothetical protein
MSIVVGARAASHPVTSIGPLVLEVCPQVPGEFDGGFLRRDSGRYRLADAAEAAKVAVSAVSPATGKR